MEEEWSLGSSIAEELGGGGGEDGKEEGEMEKGGKMKDHFFNFKWDEKELTLNVLV